MLIELAAVSGIAALGVGAYRRRHQGRHPLISVLAPEPKALPVPQKPVESAFRDIRQVKNAEKMMNVMLWVSGTSLGFAIIGTVFYPPVAILSVPFIIFQLIEHWRDAYRM